MRHNPLVSVVVGEKFGTCEKEELPSLVPFFLLTLRVATSEEL
jgi:hypothetical protein